jgi:hypothetical protein
MASLYLTKMSNIPKYNGRCFIYEIIEKSFFIFSVVGIYIYVHSYIYNTGVVSLSAF